MEKYIVEIKVPAAELCYDISVPETMQIGTMTELVCNAMTKLANGTFIAKNAVSCEKNNGQPYHLDKHVYETDIRNGTRLYLI